MLREPLLHFLVIGAGLFLLFDWKGNSLPAPGGQGGTPAAQVVVTREAIERLTKEFAKTWQRPPTSDEQQALVEEFTRNEIFYREAIAAGLDGDDEVLKRRLRQQMEFIFEDLTSWSEPTDADLNTFMQSHCEKYRSDPQLSFRQMYFNPDKRGARAEADARQALAQLSTGAEPITVGDPTMLESDIPLSPLGDVRKQFGEEFARNVFEIAPRRWAGPLRSAFGLHLVFVTERLELRQPDLSEIRERVKQDWMVAKQKEVKDAAYARIRERYTVIVEPPQAAAAPATKAAAAGGTAG